MLKIDLIGVTEKMAKNQPCTDHGDYQKQRAQKQPKHP